MSYNGFMVSQQTSDKSNVSLILSRESSSERHSYQNVVRVNFKSIDEAGSYSFKMPTYLL